MARFEISSNLVFADRREWVSNTTLPRLGALVPRDWRTHVFIHHTVTPDSDDTPNIWEDEKAAFARMRVLQITRPDLGFDVPYNFVAFIMKNGDLLICEGRGEDRAGAHTKGHNTRAIGVAFAGNFEDLPTTGAKIGKKMKLLSLFLGWLKYDPSHPDYGTYPPMPNLDRLKPAGRNVWAHSDVKATACPGKKIESHLAAIEFTDPRLIA